MKTIYIKYKTWAVLMCLVVLSACNSLTDGYSTDPVNITDPTVISTFKFLSGAQINLIGAYEGDVNRTTGMWIGEFNGQDRQYIGLANYAVSGRDFNTEWGAIYARVLENDRIIKTKARAEKNYNVLGIVQTMDAMVLGLAADLWGDVPYTEATQYPAITQPKYDPQADVYKAVQVLLDSAVANFGAPTPPLGIPHDADIFFGGDAAKWIATANTLKARYYLHTRDYAKALTYAAKGISSASDNMLATHGESYLQNFNLFYSFLSYDRTGYMGGDGYMAHLLDTIVPFHRNNAKTMEKGRLNYLYAPFYAWGGLNTTAPYDCNVLSAFDGWGNAETADGFFGGKTSFPMVTFEENQLIMAEAYAKTSDDADALAALNTLRQYYNTGAQFGGSTDYTSPDYRSDDRPKGVRLGGILYADYVMADFAPGGMENKDNIDQSKALLREILEERYVSLIGQLEAFIDVGRTNNFLGLKPIEGKNQLPMRILYPQSEVTTNPNTPQDVDIYMMTPVMKATPY